MKRDTTEAENAAALLMKDVHVSYGGLKAVENINLQVNPGEFFGLIGLNGAGKTTLIKTLLDLRSQNGGDVRIFGRSPHEKGVKKRLAFLPERFEPPWFLSGMEFLKFSARLYRHELPDQRCIEYAQRISLDTAALKRRVHTYSKGMRQKLGLLGTVLTGCDLLILDEPMSGLDPIARVQTKNLLLEAKANGCTIFLSSHILADMDEICDRVAILYDKTIRFTGPPSDFKTRNASKTLEQAFLDFIEEKSAA
jgi:ABC-2 type transport system ATP-binding protein